MHLSSTEAIDSCSGTGGPRALGATAPSAAVTQRLTWPPMPFQTLFDRSGPLYRTFRSSKAAVSRARYRTKGVSPTALVTGGSTISPDLVAGDYVFIAPGCTVQSGVEIGRYTMLAAGASIVGADHPTGIVGTPMVFAGREPLRPTKIGQDVWIGQNAIVMVGVTIGDFAIVAAGSVVTRDVPEGQVVAGVPAKVLRSRFESEDDLARHRDAINSTTFTPSFANPRHRDELT